MSTAGTFLLAGVYYKVDGRLACEQVLVLIDGDNITVADLDGEVLIEHTRPAPELDMSATENPADHGKTDETSPIS